MSLLLVCRTGNDASRHLRRSAARHSAHTSNGEDRQEFSIPCTAQPLPCLCAGSRPESGQLNGRNTCRVGRLYLDFEESSFAPLCLASAHNDDAVLWDVDEARCTPFSAQALPTLHNGGVANGIFIRIRRLGGAMNMKRVLAAGALALCTTLASVGFTAGEASAATRVGGVDVERVCQFDYGFHAYIAVWAANGWRCNPVPGNSYYKVLDRNADMNKACRIQYGSSSWSSFSDGGNPYSWSCYR